MPSSKSREIRVVASVPCPRCNARAGVPCFFAGVSGYGPHGPQVHAERRIAWQEWKQTHEPENTPQGEAVRMNRAAAVRMNRAAAEPAPLKEVPRAVDNA